MKRAFFLLLILFVCATADADFFSATSARVKVLENNNGFTNARSSDRATSVNDASVGYVGYMPPSLLTRIALSFDTSSLPDNALIDSVKVMLGTLQDVYDGTHGSYYLLQAAFPDSNINLYFFNDFTGWDVSGYYAGYNLIGAFGTPSYSLNDSLHIKLSNVSTVSRTGRTDIMLLGGHDLVGSDPEGVATRITIACNHYWRIDVWYTLIPAVSSRSILRKDGTTTPYRTDGGVTPMKQP